ncbi:MAG: aminoacyl-histidine dipeptidase [Prevotellaceae bacterium]|jgi:dipeptidase D|nr:aminoacyl-histidine dipeptidase [Prevotellaceae bacterium]
MSKVTELKPQEVWRHFYELTQIPRISKKEEKAVEFVYNFGKKLGLETCKDEVGNVVIRKTATSGFENRPTVVLQAHIDMVPAPKEYDFEKNGVTAMINGDWVTADGTTLGADNGMGVAAAMAVLESKTLKHGNIEALFTVDEETGMTGAQNLKPEMLKGSVLINLDTEDEGVFYIGCAGGVDGTFKLKYREEKIPANVETFAISVKGLNGGHSGIDINLGRGNANKILFRILKHTINDTCLSAVSGGNIRNAIPSEACACVVVQSDKTETVRTAVENIAEIIKSELQHTEPDLQIMFTKTEQAETIIEKDAQIRLINAINACPDGVLRMSDTVAGLVETSSNLAIVKSENGTVSISCLIRSSVNTAKTYVTSILESLFTLAGAESVFTGSYPGWDPNPDSAILAKAKKLYADMFGAEPAIEAVHAGLECGLLGGTYPSMDMISCGPTIKYPHSTSEKVNIESVAKWWKFLTALLESI